MTVTQLLLIGAAVVILLLLLLLLFPYIRKIRNTSGDSSEVQSNPHPFQFKGSPDNPITEKIIDAVNCMGGVGDNAEIGYQKSLDKLRTDGEEAVPIIVAEYENLPEGQYLDRWSLIQLLVELKQPSSSPALDKILSSPIPPERAKSSHDDFSTQGEEIMIRTTAIEAITQLALAENNEAVDLLLKHSQHENFSVKRAAIQDYLSIGGEKARKVLMQLLPKSDHHILNIRREDVRKIPQPEEKTPKKQTEKFDPPMRSTPKPERISDA
ncbi:MAG: HEAT repeat domain-containing protein [Thiohalocapsa sp. PB-PSB1]|jgi:hypothetical protein|nr:MAG: HEAT repeat domain-containing protein [Thiohalocapsa sp. PB-PSB1]